MSSEGGPGGPISKLQRAVSDHHGEDFADKNVGVVGFGLSNRRLTDYLLDKRAEITVYDQKTLSELQPGSNYRENDRLRFSLGDGYLASLPDNGHDVIFLTPGMPKNVPEVMAAVEKGSRLSSEVNLFLARCRAPVVGITGSSGKTTTTTLVGEIMSRAFPDVYVGGNIGEPLITRVDDIPVDGKVVLEISSFQLELLQHAPQMAAILNISPNHLDVHGSMHNYIEAKANIGLQQKPDDSILLNADCRKTQALQDRFPGNVLKFSLRTRVPRGGYLYDGVLCLAHVLEGEGTSKLMDAGDIPLRGLHNVANVLAAAVLCRLAGVEPKTMRQVVREFEGVEHRLEKVATIDGVEYYNDSIATAPDRTAAALRSFSRPVVLIAGGYDKGLSFSPLMPLLRENVLGLVLMGDTAPDIAAMVEKDGGDNVPDMTMVDGLEEAVTQAGVLAPAGGVVLLSPACASFDMFSNYKERGRLFKRAVRKLKDAAGNGEKEV